VTFFFYLINPILQKQSYVAISVAPGANSHLLPEDITRLAGVIEKADMVLLQLEIPMDTVCKD